MKLIEPEARQSKIKLDKKTLIGNIAKMVLNENREYIGDDIAEEAIKNLDNKIEELNEKGEDKNVGEEKPKAKRGRKPKAV